MKIFYPDNLPIVAYRERILGLLREHQVVVIAGETGSGKTTQLAKMVLEAFPERDMVIGCTQPRRIAASSVAARVAEELGPLGLLVGWKIRFTDTTSAATRIKFMTDGVLLAETRHDRLLSRYSAIIVDEAHERSLNIDFLLGYLKRLLPKRPDLKVIVTSATIDTEAFSRHFNQAPVLSIAGRSYPVTVRYLPAEEDEEGEKDDGLDHCLKVVSDLCHREPRGDILVFLPTERDIREACQALEKRVPDAEVLPLYGRLPAGDQKRIFQPAGRVKIVVATNVAETSITVPGIRYVVDSGLARISHYNVRAKTIGLPITKISQASADQRKGRCGRVGPGICIRLYAEEDYLDRPQYSRPELQRANLAAVILQMIALDLGNPEEFPFLDPPQKGAIREGYQLLSELGAIADQRRLTATGRIMADLPIDPCIARIIIAARDNGCLREITVLAAVLAIQDPRIRPLDKEKEADQAHKAFLHPQSDFITLLNTWERFHHLEEAVKSWSRLKKFCKNHYLSFQRMREWIDLHEQLRDILKRRDGFTENSNSATYEQIHKALLSGFLRNFACKKQERLYQGAHNRDLMIFPGSHQFHKGGQWIVAASFLETSRLYALTVATIEVDWVEPIAGSLCKYSYSEPHWEKKTGRVVALETVSLFGLILLSGRKVNFPERSPKNLGLARNIFIESALVQGEIGGDFHFLRDNQNLIAHWREVEEKMRARTVVADDQEFFRFYDERLPANVYDRKSLIRSLRDKNLQDKLRMSEETVLKRRPDDMELVDFPPTIAIGSMTIQMSYHFEPGAEDDGLTFRLPMDLALTVSPAVFEWLVPGLLREKLTHLLKGLPKTLRKKLVPINETVLWLLDELSTGRGSLLAAVEAAILKRFKFLVQRSDWPTDLPLHLQPRFVLYDDVDHDLCAGRNLRRLLSVEDDQSRGEAAIEPSVTKADRATMELWQGGEYRQWDFHGIPTAIPAHTRSGQIAGFLYPVLQPKPEKGCLVVEFEKNPLHAESANRRGTLFLLQLQFAEEAKALKKVCGDIFSGPVATSFFVNRPTRKDIVDTLLPFILVQMYGPLSATIPGEEEFQRRVDELRRRGLFRWGAQLCEDFAALARKRQAVRLALDKALPERGSGHAYLSGKRAEVQEHLATVFPRDLPHQLAPVDFAELDRSLSCLSIRIDRMLSHPAKDDAKTAPLAKHLERLRNVASSGDELPAEARKELARYQAMVNDYRIALFAPELKTRQPISEKKLEVQWQLVMAGS
jgi:ATP-dependent helicase HrpA